MDACQVNTKQCKQLHSMITQCCGEFLPLNKFYPGKTTCKKCTCLEQKARRQQEQAATINAEELLNLNQIKAENIQLRNDLEDEKLKNDSLSQTIEELQNELYKFKDEQIAKTNESFVIINKLLKYVKNMDVPQKKKSSKKSSNSSNNSVTSNNEINYSNY
jgi:septal ring factor EnvC (AmiA/AmiB activator)